MTGPVLFDIFTLQLLMGLLKLGFVAVYLSDPIISGFTTGAAILVFTSQVKHIFGLEVPRYSGAFAVVKVCIQLKHVFDFLICFSPLEDVN